MKACMTRFASVLTLLPLALANCSNDVPAEEGAHPSPTGSVATNARAAWPNRTDDVPVITPDDIARACVELAVCGFEPASSGGDRLTFASSCVSQLTWSAERAIPVSGLFNWNERAEYFVRCQLDHVGDCT